MVKSSMGKVQLRSALGLREKTSHVINVVSCAEFTDNQRPEFTAFVSPHDYKIKPKKEKKTLRTINLL